MTLETLRAELAAATATMRTEYAKADADKRVGPADDACDVDIYAVAQEAYRKVHALRAQVRAEEKRLDLPVTY